MGAMKRKVVIVGGGFAGINLFLKLAKCKLYDITLVDKNNYNYFTPLIYQVATGFIEPSSISYPFRSMISGRDDTRFWMGELQKVVPEQKKIILSDGELDYDFLILATGTRTNYFGNDNLREHAIPMNSLEDALEMRNLLLQRIEKATRAKTEAEKKEWLTMVVAGGGATGVEVAGMFAQLREEVIIKEYPELEGLQTSIYLVNSGGQLLKSMSQKSQEYALKKLKDYHVKVVLNTRVNDFDGRNVSLNDGSSIQTRNLIWATGVKGRTVDGIPKEAYTHGERLMVNEYNQLQGFENIYVLGDGCLMSGDVNFPKGHPQLAQVAIQQGKNLAKSLKNSANGKAPKAFRYKHKGSLAVIGKSRAVADLPKMHMQGFIALLVWAFVHLFGLIGRTDRLRIFFNWSISYLTKHEDLRMIIRPKEEV